MEELRIIWLLAIGLGLACIFGYLAQKAKQSPIIGYLIAGYLIGPNSPGVVVDTHIAEQLASIGVTLLMFTVGLSFNWKDLISVKKIAVPGAFILSTLSIISGTFYSMYLGESFISGFVIGVAICVSSTVVIVRVLTDQGILHSQQGHIVVGWTIVEDLISVFGLLLLPALVSSNISHDKPILDIAYPILWVFTKICILGLVVYFFGEKAIEKILKIVARTRSHELFTLAILSTMFLIAIGSAYIFGVSLALGAFIAGTIVGKTEMSHQAASNALPMRDTFAVIFFLSVGMLFSPLVVLNNIPLFFGILIILLILRPIIAFLIVKIAEYPSLVAFNVALAISQIGEYSFILAEEGSQLGILPDNAYDILVASSFITIGLNPILFQIFRSFQKNYSRDSENTTKKEESTCLMQESGHIISSFLPRAIVIGFGPIGRDVSKYLLDNGYHVLIIDQNIDTICASKNNETETLFGDATQFYILEKAKIDISTLLIITIPDFINTKSIIKTAININPFIQIIARFRFKADLHDHNFDIPTVCDEEATSEKLISMIKSIKS